MCFSLRKTQMQLALFVKKHILLFSRPACCGNLTWWNLKGLAELANLTVLYFQARKKIPNSDIF